MRHTRTKVIIINGAPQSGKDTFANLAGEYCDLNEIANVFNLSSVEPIKDMLEAFGWDGEKTDDVRNIISNIKKIWISAQNGPTMFLMHNILQFHMAHTGEDNIIFCHVREPEEIDKIKNAIAGMDTMGIDIMTMFIIRNNGTNENACDSDNPKLISKYSYDKIIYNNEDLAKYDEKICSFIEELFN